MADLLNSEQIKQYLRELAETLGDNGPPERIVVVGGALLAHHGLREGTRDVDSARQLSEDLRAAAAEVAERHGLAPDWLNARATAFRPATLDERDCEEILNHLRLTVLGAPIDQVFLMKLNSMRAADHADLELTWPHTSFDSIEEVLGAYEEAFPETHEDPFLGEYVSKIIAEADRSE